MPVDRRYLRWLGFVRYAAAVAVAVYAIVFLNPALLFGYEVRSGNVALRAQTPFPPQAEAIAAEVRRRIALSPLYRADTLYRAYLCETPEWFAVFALWDRNVGAIAHPLWTGNVFVRPSSIARNRLIGPSGQEVEGERTLTYFISHEFGHVMIGEALGRWRYAQLPVWKDDGYSDYVGKAGEFDFAAAVEAYHAGAKELDPQRSGLYLRYHLMVAFYLDDRGMKPLEFFENELPVHEVEAELDAMRLP